MQDRQLSALLKLLMGLVMGRSDNYREEAGAPASKISKINSFKVKTAIESHKALFFYSSIFIGYPR